MTALALYDFDGTITDRDTFMGIIRYAMPWHRILSAVVVTVPFVVLYKLGLYPNDKAKQRVFSFFFKGMHRNLFEKICRDYHDKYADRIIRAAARKNIAEHLTAAHTVAIVTASLGSWVRPFAGAMGIDTVIATEAEYDNNDCLTGRFATPNCYGDEKARRIRQAFTHLDRHEVWAYGDSRGDKQMLALAQHPCYKPFRTR